MTGFGAIWMISGTYALRLLSWETWLVIGVLTGLLCLIAWQRLQRARQIASTCVVVPESQSIQDRRRRFGRVMAFEWVPILLTGVVLGRISHPELILPAIAVIVGVHFIPLAKLFNVPLYYWTGGSFVLIAVVSFAIGDQVLRQAITGLGCGLTLWLTSAVLLFGKG
jgi:hypothetical protein